MQPFVIVSHHRSGSNMLAMALHSHPDAVCFGELFRRGVPTWRQPAIPHEPRHPERYLSRLMEAYGDYAAVGFKLMWQHSLAARRCTLQDPSWAKILLQRENLLAQYASRLHARQSGGGVLLNGREDRRTHLKFRASHFEAYRRHVEKAYAGVAEFVQADVGPWLHVQYTDLVRNGFGPVLDFLGLRRVKLDVPTRKRQGNDVASRFANPEDVHAHLERIGRPEWAYEAT